MSSHPPNWPLSAVFGKKPPKPLHIALALAAPFAALSLWNIWSPYSYWGDEIWSVVTSSGSWDQLLSDLLSDVHPPLYQIILKFWISIWGDGEFQTRSLSAIFSLGSIGILIAGLRSRPLPFLLAAVAFLASSHLYLIHTQDTRSYGLLLFLATAAVVFHIKSHEHPPAPAVRKTTWYTLLILLSLTHYFGLLLAGLLLISEMLSSRAPRALLSSSLAGLAMLVWPAIHWFFGGLASPTGGDFWISSQGMLSTLLSFGRAVLGPGFETFVYSAPMEPTNTILAFAGLASILVVLSYRKALRDGRTEILRISALALSFVALVAVIDLHTPVSTPRNFIVMLPLVALLVASVFQSLWISSSRLSSRIMLFALAGAYLTLASVQGLLVMDHRWEPWQNWKGLANAVDSAEVCEPHCWFISGPSKGPIVYGFYFGGERKEVPADTILSARALAELPEHSRHPMIGGNISSTRLSELWAAYPGWVCLEPVQSWANGVILIAQEGTEPAGLTRCR